ncbi:lysosomal thioesterase PPT2 [Labeo rohita]|uniref:palmitoyl-CoA hydrolase n=1 Tax=Labeo rohita TaxID=84645 RepID=A0A498MJ77_LABRO|nr:lysosomal thioesterase PPT2 [Labeo rohita]
MKSSRRHLFDRSASLQPLWKQVEGFTEAIYPIMQNAVDGVHLICYSQGGLVCRGILSTLSDHNVHSFISLSSPQAGQYGDTDYLKYLFPQFVKSNLYHVCYTAVGQKISICNYWNDPHHRDMYINSSDYLALLNNERANPNSTAWKQNFLRVKKLVLIGGADDGVITPWQSSQFGFYDENETVVEMKNQKALVNLLINGVSVRRSSAADASSLRTRPSHQCCQGIIGLLHQDELENVKPNCQTSVALYTYE